MFLVCKELFLSGENGVRDTITLASCCSLIALFALKFLRVALLLPAATLGSLRKLLVFLNASSFAFPDDF